VTEVIPRLLIGNRRDARDNHVSLYVVTVAVDSEFIGHEHFKLVDGPGNDPALLRSAARAACEAHRTGKKVLVHCHGGRSRSGAVVVLVLMELTGKNLCEAYDHLIAQHTQTRIHPFLSKMLTDMC
jgi:protein-tyrosine phosphatase